jgi:NAD(P) transhydrogenase
LAAAQLGKRVVVVDERLAEGGVCVHTGTIPSKSMREAALAHLREAIATPVSMDWIRSRVQEIVQVEVALIRKRFTEAGIEFVGGRAAFTHDQKCEVVGPSASIVFTADRFILGVGTEPRRPAFAHFDPQHRVVTSDEILKLPVLPQSLVVVGGGVIGCEYASIFAALGTKVSIVESRGALLSEVDKTIAEEFLDYLQAHGVEVYLNASVVHCGVDDDGSARTVFADGSRLRSDCVLVSAGRQRSTRAMGLEHMGIIPDERGRVATTHGQRTAHPLVHAAGDVSSVMALASTAARDGRVAAESAFGVAPRLETAPVPVGIYAIPEISYVGKTEQQLVAEGIPFCSGIAHFRETARGVITEIGRGERIGTRTGVLKLLCHSESEEILGVHIIGTGATELVHIAQAHMTHGGKLGHLLGTIYNYPTYAELYRTAALEAERALRSGRHMQPLTVAANG